MALEREPSARAVIRLSPEAGRKDGAATNENGGRSSESEGERDHMTLAQMRARVDQQSTLIAMLKQRNDETFNELGKYRQHYEETLAQRHDLELKLMEEKKARSLIEQRFHTLSNNHEEMIKIKDEYKATNQVLREENERLQWEKEEQFSEALEERERQLCSLREDGRRREERVRVVEGRCVVLEEEVKMLQQELVEREKAHEEELARERRAREVSQQRCTEVEDVLTSREKELSREQEDNQKLQISCQEKDTTLKAKDLEIADLKTELKRLQGDRNKLSQDLERLSVELSQDLQLKRMKEELKQAHDNLDKCQREFSAYKKHSSSLLQQERDLNSKLRHMADI